MGGRLELHNRPCEDVLMATNWNSRGTAMMLVGGLMVAFSVATILFTANPVPAAIAIIGLVSIGVGARKRRHRPRQKSKP